MKKAALLLLSCVASIFAQPPATVIDTVLVPLVYLKLVDNTNNIHKYVGKVTYRFTGWSNDRFGVSVSLVKDGTGETIPLTSTKGDIGASDRWGTKEVYFACQFAGAPSGTYRAKISVNASKSDTAQRIEQLISQMSNVEKGAQCYGISTWESGGCSRLGIPTFAMSDGPYGIRGGFAWPCGCGAASTWDTALIEEIGAAKAQDFRALGKNVALGPTLNIVRDPRWGRTYEAYGEDPFLNGKMTAADCRGVQKNGVLPTIKHYACNNIEEGRGNYPVVISERTFREVYGFGYQIAVREGGALGAMAAYNQVNGNPCTSNKHLLSDILKSDCGFKGFVVSDWGATYNSVGSASAGLDISMPSGGGLTGIDSWVPGQLPQYMLDDKVRRSLRAKYRAGALNAGYTVTSGNQNLNSAAHIDLMRRATRKAMVLARNDLGILPISKTKPTKLALAGRWANEMRWFVDASSLVMPLHQTSPKDAITKIGGSNISFVTDINTADYVLLFVGPCDTGEARDRHFLGLPADQDQYAGQVLAAQPNKTVLIYVGGSASTAGKWSTAKTIMIAFYPGEDHTLALAEVLFGDVNPAGRLPVTFPKDSIDVPSWTPAYEEAWNARGWAYYEYNKKDVLFPFGHGLSYTTFAYSNLGITPASAFPGDTFTVAVDVQNTGMRPGEEVVQLYVQDLICSVQRRVKDLRGFNRVSLNAGEKKTVIFKLTEKDLAYYSEKDAAWITEPGQFKVQIGPSSKDIKLTGTLTIN
jgi:beta-glucosidase